MIYRYPEEVHEFVKAHMTKLRDDDLAEECNKALGTNFNARTMKAFRSNHGYRNGRKQWTKEEYWKYQKVYPKGVYEFIRDNSWGVSSLEMANLVNAKFGTSFTQTGMKQFRQRHGIKSGCTGWYQKGHPPGTKGKTLAEICKHDPEKIARVKSTQFRKGNIPANQVPVGTISRTTNGYLIRKKQMKGSQWERWEFLHKAVWEEHHGEIPEGKVVMFKDNNKENCDISNLLLVSRAEIAVMVRKGYCSADPELTQAGLNLVRLKLESKRRRNNA